MKKLLGALALSLALLLPTAWAEATNIYDIRTGAYGDAAEVTIEKFWAAYGIATLAYGSAPPPRGVVLVTKDIFQDSIAGFYDVTTNTVWLSVDQATHEDPTALMHTLMHEIGHSLLTQQGVPIEDQHCKMYNGLDAKALMIYGVLEEDLGKYIDFFMAYFSCSHDYGH